MTAARIAALYVVFAGVATAANLASQSVVTWVFPLRDVVPASVLVGTLVGLPVKYVLDKRYIFGVHGTGRRDLRLLALYACTAVFTTAVFWGTEFLFDAVFHNGIWRLVGGALGLAVGYAVKYRLDRRFVFGPVRSEGMYA